MRMLCSCLITLLIFGGSSCGPPKPTLPMEREALVDILIDIHLAEAAVQELPIGRRDTILDVLYQEIRKQHQIDSAELAAVLLEIRREPTLVDPVYQEVLDSLAVLGATNQEPSQRR